MKFDLIVGNPPYGYRDPDSKSTNSKQIYTKIINKCLKMNPTVLQMIIPRKFLSPGSHQLKTLILKDGRTTSITAVRKEVFNVRPPICWFIYDTNHNPDDGTLVTDENDNTKVMDLRRQQVVHIKHLPSYSIINAVCNYSDIRMDSRWIRGDVSWGDVEYYECSASDSHVVYVKTTGKRGDPLDLVYIQPGVEMTGYGQNKVCMQTVGGDGSPIKIADQHHVGGNSVVFLTTSSDDESANMISYLESSLIRYLTPHLRPSDIYSKTFFSQIPVVDFSRSWTDDDLYNEFGLSPEQIAMIEEK